jgi:hypothetical protein
MQLFFAKILLFCVVVLPLYLAFLSLGNILGSKSKSKRKKLEKKNRAGESNEIKKFKKYYGLEKPGSLKDIM